jgi:hypothetical protein
VTDWQTWAIAYDTANMFQTMLRMEESHQGAGFLVRRNNCLNIYKNGYNIQLYKVNLDADSLETIVMQIYI